MWDMVIQEMLKELGNMPLLLLQATSLLGILSAMIIVYRSNDEARAPSPVAYGIVLGIAGYCLAALVSEFIQTPSKPYLRNDTLFLAGLLGGWKGGLIGGAILFIARLQFGGSGQILAAVLDMSVVSAAGIATHYWLKQRPFPEITRRQLFITWLIRSAAGLLGLVLPALLSLVPMSVILSLVARRTFLTILSLALFVGIFIIFHIDNEQRRARKLQARQARTDPLTGLPNRRALLEHLSRQFADTPGRDRSILIIEAANYVDMVLARGHDWSDRVWKEIELMLHGESTSTLLLPYSYQVFQFSDASLAIVLHDITLDEIETGNLAVALYQNLNLQLSGQAQNGPYPQLRFSVAECDIKLHRTAEATLRDVSLRLQRPGYNAQAIQYLHKTFAQTATQEAVLLEMLLQWLDNDTPPIGYQPKCLLDTGQIVGAEALLRYFDEDGQVVSPPTILALASQHQLLAAFEWSTVFVAARDAQRCRENGLDFSLSVNISGASLATAGFAMRIQHLLAEFEITSDSLTLELTETSALPDTEAVRENISLLAEFGIRLSLDDFGSGYSGLTILARIPFAEIKIDQGMVALIGDPRMKSAIELALESARRYDAKFVAEGVETEEQSAILTDIGIGIGQGYLFAPALVIDDLMHFARRQGTG